MHQVNFLADGASAALSSSKTAVDRDTLSCPQLFFLIRIFPSRMYTEAGRFFMFEFTYHFAEMELEDTFSGVQPEPLKQNMDDFEVLYSS